MSAVDLWLVISAVLFGVAVLLSWWSSNPRPTQLNSTTFIAGGLLTFIISLLVGRN